MKTITLPLVVALLASVSLHAQNAAGEIDFEKARQLFERQKSGQTLTEEERAYIQRAMALRNGKRPEQPSPGNAAAPGGEIDWEKARGLHQREQKGEKLTPDEQAYLNRAKEIRNGKGGGRPGGAAPNQRKAPEHLPPLTDLTGTDRYEGEDGGLYGGGSNVPPAAHAKAAQAQLARIQPLDANGKPSADGKIVFVSISMSNATQEFSFFKTKADASPLKSPKVTIVDCAQGGQAMAEWVPADGHPWEETKRRLTQAGVSPLQVQTAWIKLANKAPGGSLQEHGKKLEADTLAVLHNARALFPNLRIAYLGSRTYGGYANGGLNPEPYAYESAFAARWLIQRQAKGDPELAEAKSPLLLWGPYLWAEGTKGRKLDNLVWERADFGGDGVHPSESGREKVSTLLLNFLTKDPFAKSWFAK
jgi:hypothetical protein